MSAAGLLVLVALGVDAEVLGYAEARGYGVFGQGDGLDRLPIDFARAGIDPDEHWAGIARLRPTAKLRLSEESTLVATALAEGRGGFFVAQPSSIDDIASIERLYLTLQRGPVDVIAGKQLIAWGNGLLLNPTDVFNQHPVNELNAERPGVWATRLTWGVGDDGNLHLAAAVREERCCDTTVMARYDKTFATTDAAIVTAYGADNEELLVGIDVKGDLEVGLWVEAAAVFELGGASYREPYLLSELGVDYSFGDLYAALEWIHQGNGVGGAWQGPTKEPPNYLLAGVGAADPIERSLLGTNYGLVLLRYTASTTLTLQALNLVNVRDPSGTSVASVTWVTYDWLELTFGGQASWGERGGEFNLRVPESLPGRPGLGPVPVPGDLAGERVLPSTLAWLWARTYF
jgi:hypothetical protein